MLVIDNIESHGDMIPLSRVQKWPFYIYAASRVCFLAVNRSSVPHIELVLVMPVVPHPDKEVVLDAHNGGNFFVGKRVGVYQRFHRELGHVL